MTGRLPAALMLLAAAAACTPLHTPEQRAREAQAAEQATQALRAEAPASDAALAPWLAGQRGRVAQQRSAVQERFQADELACWRRFAVSDCLRGAHLQRRAALGELRQQELALNDIERQRRTAARLRQLEEKRQRADGR